MSDGGPIGYDSLIVATGARLSYFGHDDWAGGRAGPEVDRRRARDPAPDPHRLRGGRARARPGAPGAMDDLRRRRRRADGRRAGRAPSARSPGTPSGATSARSTRPTPRIILVEAMDRVLPPYPAGSLGVGAAPAREARRDRPDRHEGGRDRRSFGDGRGGRRRPTERIPARTVLWAAGILASCFVRVVAEGHRAPRSDRNGRILVGPDLTYPRPPRDLRRRRRSRRVARGRSGPVRRGSARCGPTGRSSRRRPRRRTACTRIPAAQSVVRVGIRPVRPPSISTVTDPSSTATTRVPVRTIAPRRSSWRRADAERSFGYVGRIRSIASTRRIRVPAVSIERKSRRSVSRAISPRAPGQLDTRRPAADEDERHPLAAPFRVVLALSGLERDQDPAPDLERVVERLQAGRVPVPSRRGRSTSKRAPVATISVS